MSFLPTNRDEMQDRGWEQLDIIIVSGDAYVDHPAWAAALLGRFLESRGYRVGIIAQPGWEKSDEIEKLGCPRLFFAVSAGNMDSMVNHYTADRKRRRQDVYSPGGQARLRPDRATIVYCNLIRQHFPGASIVIGGIEASLRRFAHYDYWSNTLRRSVLLDSKADLLVYGMGEYTLAEIASRVNAGEEVREIKNLRGTCYWSRELPDKAQVIPSFEETLGEYSNLVESTKILHRETNPYCAQTLAEGNGQRWVIQNPPPLPLSGPQLDKIYEMDFQRTSHPHYDSLGGIPALASVQFSITSHRGCFGTCSFCSLALHQGKFIQSRSIESIVKEAQKLVKHPDFKGTITDVGGPSANMYGLVGREEKKCMVCKKNSCLSPGVCSNINTDHSPSVQLLRRLRAIKGVKHVFVSSGVRYDLILEDKSQTYLTDLCKYHVGGQLKIAPEHISDNITRLMNKPRGSEYRRFNKLFMKVKKDLDKDLYLIPYFICGHPGSRLEDSIELAEFFRSELHFYPEQIQNFTPTPMTFSTCMYATGVDPISGQKIYVPREDKERRWQRALSQYRDPRNRAMVIEALRQGRREDLIGTGSGCLLDEKPRRGERSNKNNGTNKRGTSLKLQSNRKKPLKGRKKYE